MPATSWKCETSLRTERGAPHGFLRMPAPVARRSATQASSNETAQEKTFDSEIRAFRTQHRRTTAEAVEELRC